MSNPFRITCHSVAEIPSVNELCQRITPNQHIVLQFPLATIAEDFDKTAIIEALSPQLLDYSVFDSGQQNDATCVTIKKVIDKVTVLGNVEVFREAIDRYLDLADQLLIKLAQKLDVAVAEIESFRFSKECADSSGMLDENWTYYFHGRECQFRNETSGQVIDITLRQIAKRYLKVDPYFFGVYVHTSSQEKLAASLIKDKFHDSLRVLQILSDSGYLVD